MSETVPNNHEQDPKRDDAAQLARLYYYAADRANKVDEAELGEVVESIGSYCKFRAQQDPMPLSLV